MFPFIKLDSCNDPVVSNLTMAEQERQRGFEIKELKKHEERDKLNQILLSEVEKNVEIAQEKKQLIVLLHALVSSRLVYHAQLESSREAVRTAVREFKCNPHLLEFFPLCKGTLHLSTTERFEFKDDIVTHNKYDVDELPKVTHNIHHLAQLRHLDSRDVWIYVRDNPIRIVQNILSPSIFFAGMGVRVTAVCKTVKTFEKHSGNYVYKSPFKKLQLFQQFSESYQDNQYGLNIELFGDKNYTHYKDIPNNGQGFCVIM